MPKRPILASAMLACCAIGASLPAAAATTLAEAVSSQKNTVSGYVDSEYSEGGLEIPLGGARLRIGVACTPPSGEMKSSSLIDDWLHLRVSDLRISYTVRF